MESATGIAVGAREMYSFFFPGLIFFLINWINYFGSMGKNLKNFIWSSILRTQQHIFYV